MSLTHQQNLEAIREACIAVNPSIKDLVFGCKLNTGKDEVIIREILDKEGLKYWDRVLVLDRNTLEQRELLKRQITGNWTGQECKEWESVEIIGRDIQLADVLRTICERTKTPGNYLLSMDGYFYEWTDMDKSPKFLDIYWKTLLPLHLQEESTISFIYELIK